MNLDINYNALQKESSVESYIYRKKNEPESILLYSRHLNDGEELEYLFLIPLSKERRTKLNKNALYDLILKNNNEERL